MNTSADDLSIADVEKAAADWRANWQFAPKKRVDHFRDLAMLAGAARDARDNENPLAYIVPVVAERDAPKALIAPPDSSAITRDAAWADEMRR